jgi:adenosylcobinamide-phosphate synthase
MSFLALIAAVLLETVLPTGFFDRMKSRVHAISAGMEINLAALGASRFTWLQWWVPVLIWIALVFFLYKLLASIAVPLAGALSVFILLYSLRFKHFTVIFTNLQLFLNQGDIFRAKELYLNWMAQYDHSEQHIHTTEELIVLAVGSGSERALREYFSLVFWFLALPGPVGLVLYILVLWSVSREREHLIQQELVAAHLSMADLWRAGRLHALLSPRFILYILEWLPTRLLALTIAVLSQFDDAVLAWKQTRQHSFFSNRAPLVSVFLSAVGLLAFQQEESSTRVFRDGLVNALSAFRRILFRSMVVWLSLALVLEMVGVFPSFL